MKKDILDNEEKIIKIIKFDCIECFTHNQTSLVKKAQEEILKQLKIKMSYRDAIAFLQKYSNHHWMRSVARNKKVEYSLLISDLMEQ